MFERRDLRPGRLTLQPREEGRHRQPRGAEPRAGAGVGQASAEPAMHSARRIPAKTGGPGTSSCEAAKPALPYTQAAPVVGTVVDWLGIVSCWNYGKKLKWQTEASCFLKSHYTRRISTRTGESTCFLQGSSTGRCSLVLSAYHRL